MLGKTRNKNLRSAALLLGATQAAPHNGASPHFVRPNNVRSTIRPAGKLALLFLPLFFVLCAQPASADNACGTTSTSWTSYTASGFVTPTVICNQANSAVCPGPTCSEVREPNEYGTNTEVVCPNDNPDAPYPEFGLLRRIMPCVKGTLLSATNVLTEALVVHLGDAVAALSTLAILLLGVKMLAGTTNATWRDSIVLMAKLGGVAYFSSHLVYDPAHPGTFAVFPLALDIMDDMLFKVLGYALGGDSTFGGGSNSYSDLFNSCISQWSNPLGGSVPNPDANTSNIIWDYLDCTFEMMIGGILSAAKNSTITYGFLGFLMACVVSKGFGITIGLVGFYLVIQFVMAVVRSLYIFITGYMGLAFCIVIAPIFIPTLLFQSSAPYFTRWLKKMLGFMLQPIIVAAYLGMLLTAFNVVVFSGPYSITAALAGPAFNSNFYSTNNGIGGWALTGALSDSGSPYGQNQYGYWSQQGNTAMQQLCLDIPASQPPIDCSKQTTLAGYNGCMAQSCVYAEQSLGATGVVMNAQTISNNTVNGAPNTTPGHAAQPGDAQNYGVAGPMSTANRIDTANQTFFNAVGITSSASSSSVQFMGVDLPTRSVNWDWLAANNGNYPSGSDGTNQYVLDVLRATLMAFLVAYIFLQMLDVLPFLGSALSSGGGATDGVNDAKALLNKMSPPGM